MELMRVRTFEDIRDLSEHEVGQIPRDQLAAILSVLANELSEQKRTLEHLYNEVYSDA